MNIDSAYPSKNLKASDFPSPALLTIQGCEIQEIGRDKEKKPVLLFAEKEQGMVLNKTNMSVLKKLYGTETDNWGGKKIVAYATETEFGGQMVECIRLRAPKAQATAAKGGMPKPTPAEEDLSVDEETIPF